MNRSLGSSVQTRAVVAGVVRAEADEGMEPMREALFGRADYEAAEVPQAYLIPDRRYLALDVGSDETRAEVTDLLAVAREIRTVSGGSASAYSQMPLEGFWYAADRVAFDPGLPGVWSWIAAVCLPDSIGDELTELVIDHAASRTAERITIRTMHEGFAVQALHRGGFDTVAGTIARISAYLDANHLEAIGTYHEIYLTDPLVTPAGDACTIVRQPCRSDDPARLRPPSLVGPDESEVTAARCTHGSNGSRAPAGALPPGAPSRALANEFAGGWVRPALSGRRRWRQPRS